VTKIVIGILLFLILWGGIGAFTLASQANTVQARVGDVWNVVDRAEQLLPRLEHQLNAAYKQQADLITEIEKADAQILAGRQQAGGGNLTPQATVSTMQTTLAALQLFMRQYPQFAVGQLNEALVTETEGSINRITYARGQLIEAQAAYNQSRIIFFIDAAFFPPMQILGSNQNPAQQLPPSQVQP
jgi:hypothetical protein